eukprot:contig_42432_g9594
MDVPSGAISDADTYSDSYSDGDDVAGGDEPPSDTDADARGGGVHGVRHPPSVLATDGGGRVPPSPGTRVRQAELRKLCVSTGRPRSYAADFVEVGTLGAGDFSTVTRARSRVDGVVYAVKRSKVLASVAARAAALNEVWVLAAVAGHPHIVRYHGAWLEDRGRRLYIQTALAPGGDLDGRCKALRQAARTAEAAAEAATAAEAAAIDSDLDMDADGGLDGGEVGGSFGHASPPPIHSLR